MPSVEDIDWSQVSLERGMTPEKVIYAYESAMNDLAHLNRDFNRYFSGKRKKASIKFMSTAIFDKVQLLVYYDHMDYINTKELLQFIAADDRPLFKDICMFVYQFIHEQPKSDQVLDRFKGLLVYYMCKCGF